MSERISATEASRRLSDLLNRVRYRGDSFVIERNGLIVARLSPVAEQRQISLASILDLLVEKRSGDPAFADDLERIQVEQGTPGADPWAS